MSYGYNINIVNLFAHRKIQMLEIIFNIFLNVKYTNNNITFYYI